MEIKDRASLEAEVISAIVNNTLLKDLLGVYSQVLKKEMSLLSDTGLVEALNRAGYSEIVNRYVDENSGEVSSPSYPN